MEAKDIPFLAAMVFPGFIAIQGFFWATRAQEMSAAMRIIWAFFFSVPIFFALHGISRHILYLSSNSLPSPEDISSSPTEAPIWFLVSLYLGALLAGYLFGQLWRRRVLDRPLELVGLDLRQHRDVLSQALSQEAYIHVTNQKGEFVRGWPRLLTDPDTSPRFVYLVRAQYFRPESGWSEERDILIPVDRIELVHFEEVKRPLWP